MICPNCEGWGHNRYYMTTCMRCGGTGMAYCCEGFNDAEIAGDAPVRKDPARAGAAKEAEAGMAPEAR